MCGIAGFINLKGSHTPERQELERMIHAVNHRGPDGYGFYCDEAVGLAHARLSIIDLEGGDQPIRNEDGGVQVVFNGEIFNYLELRRELEKLGHQFYTHSDTEVIVHLYEEYGQKFVDYLNGQFAIALWDSKAQQLILVRDRVGIRPLFFTHVNDRLYFASEIKALLCSPSIDRSLDVDALGQIFTYWAPLPPNSIFKGISSLPPGHMMVVRKGEISQQSYWDWKFPTERILVNSTAEELAEELRDLLIDSVRLQLQADVPVGAYLSGGLDSSVITSLIKNYTDVPLRTFSVAFEDDEFDESGYQKELMDYLDTMHTQVLCRKTDIGEAFPRVVWHTESAILRTAPTPLMLLSSTVRSAGYKVVLTGEGADEVFGGYDLFKEAKIRRFWARQPDSKIRPLILQRLYPYLKHSPIFNDAYAKRFFQQGLDSIDESYFSHVPRWLTTSRAKQFFNPEVTDHLKGVDYFRSIESILPDAISRWQPLNRDQYIEAHTLMSGYLLNSQGDRVAMANSIEGRFPFLDHRVIEFANLLPARYKIMGTNEKYLLKRAMKGLIPESIRKRTKQPYRAPDSQSFFINGKTPAYIVELLSENSLKEAGYFNPLAVAKLMKKCKAGRAIGFGDNMAFVGILSTMLLHELFINNTSVDDLSSKYVSS